jgi:hypothetical protein
MATKPRAKGRARKKKAEGEAPVVCSYRLLLRQMFMACLRWARTEVSDEELRDLIIDLAKVLKDERKV